MDNLKKRIKDRQEEKICAEIAAHCAGYKFSHWAVVSGYLGTAGPLRQCKREGRGGVLRYEIHLPSLLTGDKHNHRMEVWLK